MKERNSSFEVLRILSMFMIIVWHITTHGILNDLNYNSFNNIQLFLISLVRSFSVPGVNLFLLISSYFLYNSYFNMEKVIKLLLQTQFFSILLYVTSIITGVISFSIKNLISSFLPVLTFQYWFVSVYIVLYVLSPYLKKIIDNSTKKQHLYTLIGLFFINSIWSFVLSISNLGSSNGYGITHFIFIYFLGSYLKEYNLLKINKYFYLFCFIVISTVLAIFNVHILSEKYSFSYNSPIVILSSICGFMFFSNMSYSYKIINNIAKAMFGVYLIHEYPPIRQLLWVDSGIINAITTSKYIVLNVIFTALITMAICTFFSWAINIFFNAVFVKIKKSKISSLS